MPRLVNKVPQLTRHKSGQARVRYNGKCIYFGKYGTPEADERYEGFSAIACAKPSRRTVRHRRRSLSSMDRAAHRRSRSAVLRTCETLLCPSRTSRRPANTSRSSAAQAVDEDVR